MKLTEREHRRLAAIMDQAARRKGLRQAEREEYLLKATRFRLLARRAAELAKVHSEERKPNLHLVKS